MAVLRDHGRHVRAAARFSYASQKALAAFEPATPGQAALHQESFYRFNSVVEFRRLRADCVKGRLDGILWMVVLAGSFMSFAS